MASMGWYSAVGRRMFFALPPEASHRLANRLLGSPLPWERLGGATRDPLLAVTVGGLVFDNPVGLAAGFDKTCRHLDALGRLGFGYVVGGTITLDPRRRGDKPRIVRLKDRGSLVNSMGLPNPGAVRAAHDLARTPRTAPRLVSLADESTANAVAALELLEPFADGFELNASCPNVSWGRDRDNEAHLADLLGAFARRTDKPIFVKLPPFMTEVEREVVLALAKVAEGSGAAGLTCSNTRPVDEPGLHSGRGGLSGRLVSERTPVIVATGEIEAGRWRFKELLEKDAAQILQTDAAVCGGITEWKRIAATAASYGVTICPHWFHDLHAHLVAATPNARYVEFFPDDQVLNFRRLVDTQLKHKDGNLLLPQTPGLGFNFNEKAVRKYTLNKAKPWTVIK